MIEAGLTQSRRAAKVGIEPDPAGLRAFVPSCESISYDHDSACSGQIGDDQETWLQTTVTGPGTLTFDYKLSAQWGDEFVLQIDGQYRFGRNGSIGWNTSGPWTISGAGTHTIRWKFIKDSSGSSGSDCLWIDRIRWTGAMPDGEGWDRIEYAYDAAGRRIEKKVDGTPQVKFVYDGDHIIAEYNNAGTLLRKYVHGPCTDEPICMIEASGTYAGTHYYHYDALGSCVAMTNSAGNVVQLYEYSVYGQVAASDADHPNRFMFTGREFDKDTGLYYYRARYYHPEIGRFLQTDPIGYGDGMNWYTYCRNAPVNAVDALGTAMLSQATGRAAISQGAEGNWILTGSTMVVNWTQLINVGAEALGKAADAQSVLYDVAEEVAIDTLAKLMLSYTAGAIVNAATTLISDAAVTINASWRAFIEVKDYNDTNNNGVVDPGDWKPQGTEKDLWSRPYWVELKGVYPIGTPEDPTGGAGSHWQDGAGYDSASAAFSACQRAMVVLVFPAEPMKAFNGQWASGWPTPLVNVNDATAKELLAIDMTYRFIESINNLVIAPSKTN